MTELVLTGMDAQNPLAFFAALGLLRVLDDAAVRTSGQRPRLGFRDQGSLTPYVVTSLGLDDVIRIVIEDAAVQADNPALRIAYDDEGNERPPNHPDASHDLKPPPALARKVMERLATAPARASRLGAAFFAEFGIDRSGKTKPTSFHFTAGKQAFLAMVEKLRANISAADLREALVGPWQGTSKLPSLSWDCSVTRLYALRAGNPADEKRGSVPAANWLGLIGLEFFPVNVIKHRLVTTCVEGGWKNATFTWPVWSPASSASTIGGLLRANVKRLTTSEREAMGILAVLQSSIVRSDYGGFSPAAMVIPKSKRSAASGKNHA